MIFNSHYMLEGLTENVTKILNLPKFNPSDVLYKKNIQQFFINAEKYLEELKDKSYVDKFHEPFSFPTRSQIEYYNKLN